jgi:hypothetical protein
VIDMNVCDCNRTGSAAAARNQRRIIGDWHRIKKIGGPELNGPGAWIDNEQTATLLGRLIHILIDRCRKIFSRGPEFRENPGLVARGPFC